MRAIALSHLWLRQISRYAPIALALGLLLLGRAALVAPALAGGELPYGQGQTEFRQLRLDLVADREQAPGQGCQYQVEPY